MYVKLTFSTSLGVNIPITRNMLADIEAAGISVSGESKVYPQKMVDAN
jgi:hypothetical protein